MRTGAVGVAVAEVDLPLLRFCVQEGRVDIGRKDDAPQPPHRRGGGCCCCCRMPDATLTGVNGGSKVGSVLGKTHLMRQNPIHSRDHKHTTGSPTPATTPLAAEGGW